MNYFTGHKGINKQGLSYEVVNYVKSKEIHIRFDIDGLEKVTTRAYLGMGLPTHNTYGKPKELDEFKDSKGNIVKLVKKDPKRSGYWFVEWLKDGVVSSYSFDIISNSKLKHPTDDKILTGDRFTPNNGYSFEVLKVNNARDIAIRFEDGSVHTTTAGEIRKGIVGHPTSGLTVGQEVETNSKWKGTISYYKSCYDVGIKWQDGSESSHPAGHVKNGGIKPLFQPSLCGVGFFGQGKYVNARMAKGTKAPDEIFQYWQRMIVRCFDPKEIMKSGGTKYKYVEVCKDWFNFQNFAEWAIIQPNWNCSNELDKDLLGTGYEYSPENCTFLPAEVNTFLADQYKREVHDLPKGVQYLKPGTAGAKVGYVARCHTDKGREYLGYFDDPLEAFKVYKVAKERYAKILAERYKDRLTEKAYEKLKTFTVEP